MRRKISWGIIVSCVIVGIVGASHSSTPTAQLNITPVTSQNASTPAKDTSASQSTATSKSSTPATAPTESNTGTTDNDLSNTNTYTNTDGNTVHSPAYSTDSSVPAGATAECSDGTYSFSQHHSGTCSGHGGVAEWL